MQKAARPLNLDLKECLALEDLVSSRRTPDRVRLRCQIVLAAARGLPNTQIADQLKITRPTVQEWRRRYQEGGLATLLSDAKLAEDVLQDTRLAQLKELLERSSPEGAPWSIRTLALALETSPTTVHRLLEMSGLKWRPKSSTEIDLEGRIERLVGLYVHPPLHAVALECSGQVEPPRASNLSTPGPGTEGWRLLLHLRSIEALRGMEGFSTHYPSNFLRFVSRVPASSSPGRMIMVVTDLGIGAEYLAKLSRECPHLRIVNLPSGLSWLDAMRNRILPALQARMEEGVEAHLSAAACAAEQFLRENRPDPLLWSREAATPSEARDSTGPIPLLFLRKSAEGSS